MCEGNQSKSNGTDVKDATEPSELDPCVEDSKNKPKSDFFHRYRDEVCEKSGLSHKGVYIVGGIVIFAFLLLIVVIALAAAWPRIPHRFQFPICENADCLRAASQIQEGLDSSISACDDIWNFTCAGWLKKYPLPQDRSIWNRKQQLVKQESERVRDLIATLKLPLHTNTVEWKLKYLYEVCLDVDNVKLDEARPLTNIISQLGGWYILRDWSETDFEGYKVLENLHVRYGVSPFFKISVEPNPNMPGHNSIRISPSGLGLPDKKYYYMDEEERVQTAYKQYIRDVIIYLSTAANEATKFGTDMFSYEKRIAEVTPNTSSLQNPIHTYNPVSLSELKDTIKILPFYDILLAMYPESNITENTEVIVTSMDYLGQIAQIIASTDRKTLNGYLIWTLVRTYIPYLSDKYTSALDSFESELYGPKKPLQRWEMCSNLVKKFMGLAVNNYMEKIDPLTEKTIKVVNNTFEAIVNVIKKRINKFEDTILLHKHLSVKLSNLKLQIGVPNKAKDENFLKKYYLGLKIMKSSFFETVRNGIHFQKKIEEKILANTAPEETVLSHALAEVPKVVYSPSDHVIVIPRSLLTEPLFEDDYPSSIIYGRLGVEIAEAIVSSVLPYDSLWTADRKILSPFHRIVEESIKTVWSPVTCLTDHISNTDLVIPEHVINETSLKTSIHLSGVRIANEALLLSLEEKEHAHQPSLEDYEDSALFFISYAQMQCSDSTAQQRLYEEVMNFELPQKSLLQLSWMQISEFPESFECSANKNLQCRDIF